ncbi:uncharacterized protein LOC143482301 [Brachyhypopomus gauderio]|uniref:uncharacterized protein LOC143482301 n=1 Tax=Brachyhypopomus gauderio TaxID=698409 RepID=UPI004041C8F2
MAFYTRSLQDLPRITINDVTRIIHTSCRTSSTMKEKAFKLYISSYVHNYEAALRLNTSGINQGLWSSLYKGVSSLLPEVSALRVDEVYCGLSSDVAPMITTMGISSNVLLVDSAFGKVQEGSVLSYHMPMKRVPKTCPHTDAPSPPQLPHREYRLGPSTCSFICTEHQQLHMMSLETSLETAHKIENSTKEQSSCVEWHKLRQSRVTSSKFREVCHTRGQSSAENLAKRLVRPSHQTADMRRGLELEPVAVEEYCQAREVNHYPCGFLTHPDAPWMGSSPDGSVYDPKEQPEFGLVEIKCPNVTSYVDCPYIEISEGTNTQENPSLLLTDSGPDADLWIGLV